MTLRRILYASIAHAVLHATLGITVATAQDPPAAGTWNIASSGKAASSGELLFRVTPGNGEDAVEVTVFVLSGSNETGIASSIKRNFTLQLDAAEFDVRAGQGANVLVSQADAGPDFAVELLDSDVENVRVTVQNIAPVAPPTVPPQSVPATAPHRPENPPQTPGDANPPQDAALPSTPSPDPEPPVTPSAPPANPQGSEAAGAPASAPPPGD